MNYRINCKWWFAKYSSSISTCPIYHVAKEKWWILQRKKLALLLLKPITFKGCLSCIVAKGNRVERCTMLAKLSGKYQKMCILLWNAIIVISRVNPVGNKRFLVDNTTQRKYISCAAPHKTLSKKEPRLSNIFLQLFVTFPPPVAEMSAEWCEGDLSLVMAVWHSWILDPPLPALFATF